MLALIAPLLFILLLGGCWLLMKLWAYLQVVAYLDRLSEAIWQRLPASGQRILQKVFDSEGRRLDVHRLVSIWLLVLAGAAVLAFIYQTIWPLVMTILLLLYQVSRQQRTFAIKQRRLKHELPDFCDLLAMTIAAGIPLIPALNRVANACEGGLLAKEIVRVDHQLRQGMPFAEALQRFAGYYQVTLLTEWSTLLIQGHQQGSSLVTTLRFHSLQMRQQLLNEAEKRAQEAPVKLLFPLMTCFFPVNFLVILGPIVLQVMAGGF